MGPRRARVKALGGAGTVAAGRSGRAPWLPNKVTGAEIVKGGEGADVCPNASAPGCPTR